LVRVCSKARNLSAACANRFRAKRVQTPRFVPARHLQILQSSTIPKIDDQVAGAVSNRCVSDRCLRNAGKNGGSRINRGGKAKLMFVILRRDDDPL